MMRRASTMGIVLALLAFGTPPPVHAQPDARNVLIYRPTTKVSQLSLSEKEVRLLELPSKIKTVDSFDPAVVKITTELHFAHFTQADPARPRASAPTVTNTRTARV